MWETGRFESIYDTPDDIGRRALARQEMELRSAARRPQQLWEQYVRDFITRYSLNEEQQQKAWLVLLDCRKQADSVLQKIQGPLDAANVERNAAHRKGDQLAVERAESRVTSLLQPVSEIFEKQLRPRLDRLPTASQRRGVSSAPTSRPIP